MTLVHELTHALQDQHFDLGRLQELEGSGESAAFRALVEGDASLVESFYVEQLPTEDRDEYDATYLEQVEDAGFDEIPGILTASFGASYALGEPLVGIVQHSEGWDGVDDMFRDPPTTELELFDALSYLDGFTPVLVDVPEVEDGHDVVDEGDFGAITLYLMLAARMDPVEALAVTDQWAGDAYLTSRDPDGRICTEVVVAARDADVVEDALDAWVDAAPAESDATLDRTGDRLRLRSCDPGSEVDVTPTTDPLDAIAVPATRSYLLLGVVTSGLDPSVGACVADQVLAEVPLDVLSDPDPSPEVLSDVQSTMFDSMQKCAA